MNFMIPTSLEESRPEKLKLGPVNLEQQLGNHLAFRLQGNLAEGFDFDGRSGRSGLAFPNETVLFIAVGGGCSGNALSRSSFSSMSSVGSM